MCAPPPPRPPAVPTASPRTPSLSVRAAHRPTPARTAGARAPQVTGGGSRYSPQAARLLREVQAQAKGLGVPFERGLALQGLAVYSSLASERRNALKEARLLFHGMGASYHERVCERLHGLLEAEASRGGRSTPHPRWKMGGGGGGGGHDSPTATSGTTARPFPTPKPPRRSPGGAVAESIRKSFGLGSRSRFMMNRLMERSSIRPKALNLNALEIEHEVLPAEEGIAESPAVPALRLEGIRVAEGAEAAATAADGESDDDDAAAPMPSSLKPPAAAAAARAGAPQLSTIESVSVTSEASSNPQSTPAGRAAEAPAPAADETAAV